PWSAALALSGLARRFGLRQKAGSALLPQAIAIAADREDLAVMEQAIEDRGRHHGIAEDAAPLADRAIAGDEHAAALVAARDELEEEVRGFGLEWEIAELVDDQKLRLRPVREPLLESMLELGLAQLRDECVRGDEEDAV